MGVVANPSSAAVVTQGQKLYTGISNFNVIAVNPTLEELHKLDIMLQKEPAYSVNFGEGDLTKIVFWLDNGTVKTSCEFLVTPGRWMSKGGKVKCLNRLGQDQWLFPEGDGFNTDSVPEWIKEPETFYPIPKGLDKVTEFVRAWANVADGGEIRLDTIAALEKGNVAELKKLVTILNTNEVRCLAYVRQEKYMAIYTEHFGRIKPQRDDLFGKALAGEYGAIKGEYSIEWQEYMPGQAAPTALDSSSDGDDWEMPDSPITAGTDLDEDPFS